MAVSLLPRIFSIMCILTSASASMHTFTPEHEDGTGLRPLDDPSKGDQSVEGLADASCPAWAAWRTSPCFWPNLPRESYPCTAMNPLYRKYPQWIQQLFYTERQFGWYDRMRAEWEQRGRPAMCGQCAVRWRCRQRQVDSNQNMPEHCRFIEDAPLPRSGGSCAGSQPCEMAPVDGVCSPPGFLLTDDAILGPWIAAGGSAPFSYAEFGKPDRLFHLLKHMADEVEGISATEKRRLQSKIHRIGALNKILNQTNCAKDPASGRCLCCCAPFLPNVQTRQCIDVKNLFETELRALIGEAEAALGERVVLMQMHDETVGSEGEVEDGFDIAAVLKEIADAMMQ